MSEDRHERPPGHVGVEAVAAVAPPPRRADRDIDLPGQPGPGPLGRLIEAAAIRVADDEHVYVGRRPARLQDLLAAGLWRAPLTDAAGFPFSYDEKSGRVTISHRSPMWRRYGSAQSALSRT